MAIQDALAFLSRARRDDAIGREIEALGEDMTLGSLSEVAARAGLRFTPAELERAHALDWRMRWQRYASKTRPTD